MAVDLEHINKLHMSCINSFINNNIVWDLVAVISDIIHQPLYNIVENNLDSSIVKLAANVYFVDNLLNSLWKLFCMRWWVSCFMLFSYLNVYFRIISCVLEWHNHLNIFKSLNLKEVPDYILVNCTTLVGNIVNFMSKWYLN